MRRLVWFAIGFCAAAAICAYVLSGAWPLLAAGLCVPVFICLYFLRKKISLSILLVLIGFAAGLVYFWCFSALVLSPAKQYDGEEIRVKLTATDYSYSTDYGKAVDGYMRLDGKRFRTRLYFQGQEAVAPGDTVTIRATMRYTPADSIQNSTYHKGEGIFLLAYGEQIQAIQKRESFQLRYTAAYIRKLLADRILQLFPEDTAAFAKALLLGDDSDISFQDNIAFQKSGIRHVIAVSGLHVSILFSVVYFVTGKKKLPMLLAGFPVLVLFAAVAGFSPSVIRACVMQALLILSLAVDREYDGGTALAFSCLGMLVWNPLTITSVSFQLSVGCMIGIFLFSGPIRDYLHNLKFLKSKKKKGWRARLKSWLVGSVSISISVMIFTLPLCALYFDTITVIGIVTNLLTLWVISYIFYGIIAACLLSALWLPAGSTAAWLVSWTIRYVLTTAKLLSRVPAGTAYTDSPFTIAFIVLTCVLLVVFYISKRKRPGILAAVISGIYVLTLVATWGIPRLDAVRLTVVDVGQGQCVLLHSKDSAYMIDCGGENSKLAAEAAICAMGSQGIHRLDGLILTHYDADHCNGVMNLLSCVEVDRLYLPDTEPESEMRRVLEKQDKSIRWVTGNVRLGCGTGSIQIIPAKNQSEGNESSMCILFHGETCDILITGDRDIAGEETLLSQESIARIDYLVVGHHGANTSTGLALLQQIKPDVAIISVGKGNLHGHPDDETLNRLRQFGCTVRRTDLEGTIIIRR